MKQEFETLSSTTPVPAADLTGLNASYRKHSTVARPSVAFDPTFERDACGVGGRTFIGNQRSHAILQNAITVLERMDHRGACGCDPDTGDGSGIMTEIPDRLFRKSFKSDLPAPGAYGVGQIFLPRDETQRNAARAAIENACTDNGFQILGWREVGVRSESIGFLGREQEPKIEQLFIVPLARSEYDNDRLERNLFLCRLEIERALASRPAETGESYVCSLSSRTVIYKGLCLPTRLREYFDDLHDERFETRFGLVHSRFSTNSFPAWPLAHPYRMLAHNGEINTVSGNRNSQQARAPLLSSKILGDTDFNRVVASTGSDSRSLDNMIELLVRGGGFTLPEAMAVLVPEAWENDRSKLSPQVRAMFEYFAAVGIEPWDGPAALCACDGRHLVLRLDRNGLRPCRYAVTKSGEVIFGSEVGIGPDVADEQIVTKGRVRPGDAFVVDLRENRIVPYSEVLQSLAERLDFAAWTEKNIVRLEGSDPRFAAPSLRVMRMAGYNAEDVEKIMVPMAATKEEPTGSMGDHQALPVLSQHLHPQPFANSFKQMFAQVTNPPIDPIRERSVMSLAVFLGPRGNPLDLTELDPSRHVKLESPVLTSGQLHELRSSPRVPLKSATIDALFDATEPGALKSAIGSLCYQACAAVKEGNTLIVISDRNAGERQMIPIEMAVSAVHAELVRKGLRGKASLVVESAQPREVHQIAVLLASGAEAVNPYLALDIVADRFGSHLAYVEAPNRSIQFLKGEKASANYVEACNKGLLKIMSKMGISTVRSYTSSRLFELIGVDQEVLNACFPGFTCRTHGMGFDTIERDWSRLHQFATKDSDGVLHAKGLPHLGFYSSEPDGEKQRFNSDVVRGLQTATRSFVRHVQFFDSILALEHNDEVLNALRTVVRRCDVRSYGGLVDTVNAHSKAAPYDSLLFRAAFESALKDVFVSARASLNGECETGSAKQIVALVREKFHAAESKAFQDFCAAVDGGTVAPWEPRRFVEIKCNRPAIPLAEVEGWRSIATRFMTGAMSLGSISPEAHETIAVAMNTIGGRSNTGEGGEDPRRFATERNSAIKQIAAGRFGVDALYLVSAKELQIKMAQGAKPGEGGQLPGQKINAMIAAIRRTTPGVSLISPPPHHDIYSIEDLAELIFDLGKVNPESELSVKLVAEAGVGIVAAGVVKAGANRVVISGGSGGTGASPQSSLKHAGLPLEFGLLETQAVLRRNGLRSAVRLQVDGALMTPRDVVLAALMGADEFAFSTAPLVALGCTMQRVCHLGACDVGIATQDEALRKKFQGEPAHVINYFRLLAEGVRAQMAELGYRTMSEMVGDWDALRADGTPHRAANSPLPFRGRNFNLTRYLDSEGLAGARSFKKFAARSNETLDDIIAAEAMPKLMRGESHAVSVDVDNSDRAVMAKLSGDFARRWGVDGPPDGAQLTVRMRGSAGQSLGAFLAPGIRVELTGEANDYVGKGLSGGTIVVRPPSGENIARDESSSIIAGNTLLYGATRGKAFICGSAAERFAVRNSGAKVVVEGVGDHACEYMTGGVVVVLGNTGDNVAAGMSGGIAYVLDSSNKLTEKVSSASNLRVEAISNDGEYERLLELIREHAAATDSVIAGKILADSEGYRGKFKRIVSQEFEKARPGAVVETAWTDVRSSIPQAVGAN